MTTITAETAATFIATVEPPPQSVLLPPPATRRRGKNPTDRLRDLRQAYVLNRLDLVRFLRISGKTDAEITEHLAELDRLPDDSTL